MLVNLSVRNFALVKSLEIGFTSGLTAITGESGAGKTILLDALSLVLGARSRRDQMRASSSGLEVIAEFDVANMSDAKKYLGRNELVDSVAPNRCVVRRTSSSEGRSRAWINGVQVNLDVLRTFCDPLVGIHTQFEQHQLLDPAVQLKWLDDFGIDRKLRSRVQQSYHQWQDAKTALETSRKRAQEELNQLELLTYQVEELDQLELKQGEFEELSQSYKRYSQAQEIQRIVTESIEILDSEINANLSSLNRALNGINDSHPLLSEIKSLIDSAQIHTEESVEDLRKYRETLTIDSHALEAIEQRLDLVHDIARKHKVSPSQLLERSLEVRRKFESLRISEEELANLESSVVEHEENFRKLANRLSKCRKTLASTFQREIVATLENAALPGALFDIAFSEALNETGVDEVEYLISTNRGYDPLPMSRIASGGELSRIALAVLVVVAKKSDLPCLILDEADVGVGGITADVVGRMLRSVAQNNQIVCVTHAPQVAAVADSHIHVFKTNSQEINVRTLCDDDRVEEVARMVSGRRIDADSRNYARTLLSAGRS